MAYNEKNEKKTAGFMNLEILDKSGNVILRIPTGLPVVEGSKTNLTIDDIIKLKGEDYQFTLRGTYRANVPVTAGADLSAANL